jgi:hypothetical protein
LIRLQQIQPANDLEELISRCELISDSMRAILTKIEAAKTLENLVKSFFLFFSFLTFFFLSYFLFSTKKKKRKIKSLLNHQIFDVL